VSTEVREREWDYSPVPDGEPYEDRDGHWVVGWHPRSEGQDAKQLCAEFEAFDGHPLVLRPILTRFASEVECKIKGWDEGTFTPCTSRAKNPMPMWQIEWVPDAEAAA
jgi:hypothetical protein